GPPKGYIEAIETRLHRMESLLGGLVHSNDPFAEAVLAELMQDDPRPSRKSGNTEFTWRNGSISIHGDTGSSGLQSPEIVQAKDNSIIDDLNDIMGILSIDENQQVRYHGRSSGLYLLKNNRDNPPPLLLLNAIYALAARFSDRPELRKNLQDSQTAGDEFFDRAKALLDNDYDKSHITTIQALIIMALRDIRIDNTTRSWIYIGMAARMAQDLGIHRNNEKWQPIPLSREEKEEQKRAFWSCFVVD
ncbi:702_t:CDS:2, partial [Racocetra persica]